MKKRIVSALLCVTMLASLMIGCGTPAAADTTPAAKEEATTVTEEGEATEETAAGIAVEDIKVGFVHVSDPSDMGYTYNHDLGTIAMKEALGLTDDQIINKFNVTEDAACDTALRELVDAGCNIIFATSFGFEDYVKEIAAEYPEIQFCHATGYQAAGSGLSNIDRKSVV